MGFTTGAKGNCIGGCGLIGKEDGIWGIGVTWVGNAACIWVGAGTIKGVGTIVETGLCAIGTVEDDITWTVEVIEFGGIKLFGDAVTGIFIWLGNNGTWLVIAEFGKKLELELAVKFVLEFEHLY